MELATLLDRMKLDHLAAQLDGICEHAAHSDVDFKGFLEGPVILEFRVEQEDAVYPMVPAGSALHEMIRRPAKSQ